MIQIEVEPHNLDELKKMRSLAENTPNLIIIADPHGRIQFVNRTLSGIDIKKVVGRNIYEYIQPEYHDIVKETIRRVYETGDLGSYEVRGVDSSGKISWFETQVGQIKQDDQVVAVSLISTDISERKKVEIALKESEDHFRTIAEQSFMGISILQDGVIKYTNKKLADIHGRSEEQLLKWKTQDFLKTIHPDEIGNVLEEMTSLINADKDISQFEMKSIREDGKIIWLNQFSKRIEFHGRPAIITNIIDITERKENEEKVKNSEAKYREAFNRAEFYKDLFTHDMNNILQNILSANDLIKLYHSNPDYTRKIQKLLELVTEQVNRGSKLITNIQKLSQLEDYKEKFQKIEIMNLMRKACNIIKNLYRDKIIEISINSSSEIIYVQANELIEDIFENLLINAVKHNRNPKVEITINFSRLEENGSRYHKIEFIDNGMGVDDQQKELIFQRTKTDAKGVSGIGLGLSLVNKIIESYNGKIWVQDRISEDYLKGSNFTILIPEAS
ncbi:MAG: PAS domain S-box protein [Promethearchaeota archaeon]